MKSELVTASGIVPGMETEQLIGLLWLIRWRKGIMDRYVVDVGMFGLDFGVLQLGHQFELHLGAAIIVCIERDH
jgi:hypothetical protein